MEKHRKLLLANNPEWGDQPHVLNFKPRQPCSRCFAPNSSSALGAMNRTMEHLPPPRGCAASTKGWSLDSLVQRGERFRHIPRISLSAAILAAKVTEHGNSGIPLIIQECHQHPKWLKSQFSPEWLKAYGPEDIDVRNVHDWSDKIIPFSDFIAKSRQAPHFAYPEEQERLYGKDAPCPDKWNKWLHEAKVIPSNLLPEGPNNLMCHQPRSLRVETLMCYLGVGDTFTPCHKDLCASSGQNLMCYTENGGSSFWFMTKSSDAPEASKYFRKLNQELDHETHVITIEELAEAPFEIFIAEQKLGDLVLVPPRSCHQVVNYGGITIKVSWSRMTLKGLETAYYHELPIYQRVCRLETYRVKSTIYYVLRRKTKDLESIVAQSRRGSLEGLSIVAETHNTNLGTSMKLLLELFNTILVDEYSSDHDKMPCLSSFSRTPNDKPSMTQEEVAPLPITCDFCGADIFQSFFECRKCVLQTSSPLGKEVPVGDGYVICSGCYVDGRSCKCCVMDPIQCRPFEELLRHREEAEKALLAYTRNKKSLPLPAFLHSEMGTFRAACILQRARENNKKDNKVCTLPKGSDSTHIVPFSWALTCKKCHNSKCFMHILMDQKIHATDALLIHASDLSHEQHHQRHRNGRNEYDKGLDAFLSSQKRGSRPDLSQQRVHTALDYGVCKPINPQFMSLGWYDRDAQILHHEPEDYTEPTDPIITTRLLSLPPLSPLSSLSSLPSSLRSSPAPILEPNISNSRPKSSAAFRKRTREILDYIAVPSPPFKRKCQFISPSDTINPGPMSAQHEHAVDIQIGLSAEPPTLPARSSVSAKTKRLKQVSTHHQMSSLATKPTEPLLSSPPAPVSAQHVDLVSNKTSYPPHTRGTSNKRKKKTKAAISASCPGSSSNPLNTTREQLPKRPRMEQKTLPNASNGLRSGKRPLNNRPHCTSPASSSPSSSTAYPRSTDSGLARALNCAAVNNHEIHDTSDTIVPDETEHVELDRNPPEVTTRPPTTPNEPGEVEKLQSKIAALESEAAEIKMTMAHFQPQVQTPAPSIPPEFNAIVSLLTNLRPVIQVTSPFPSHFWPQIPGPQPWPTPTYTDQQHMYYPNTEQEYHRYQRHSRQEQPESYWHGWTPPSDVNPSSRWHAESYYNESNEHQDVYDRRMEPDRSSSYQHNHAEPHERRPFVRRPYKGPRLQRQSYNRPSDTGERQAGGNHGTHSPIKDRRPNGSRTLAAHKEAMMSTGAGTSVRNVIHERPVDRPLMQPAYPNHTNSERNERNNVDNPQIIATQRESPTGTDARVRDVTHPGFTRPSTSNHIGTGDRGMDDTQSQTWEDEYEQEDPGTTTPQTVIFKDTQEIIQTLAFTDLEVNPWQ